MSVYGLEPQDGQSLDCFSFNLCSTLFLHNSSQLYLVSSLRMTDAFALCIFFFLIFHVVYEIYLEQSHILGLYPLISESIPCVFFCDWVTSHRIIFVISIHVSNNFLKSLFSIAEQYSIVENVAVSVSIHLLKDIWVLSSFFWLL